MNVSATLPFNPSDWIDLGEDQEPDSVFTVGQEAFSLNEVFTREFNIALFLSSHTASEVQIFDKAISCYLLKEGSVQPIGPILHLLENFPSVSTALTSTASTLYKVCLKSLESLYGRNIRMEGEEQLFNKLKKHPILSLEQRTNALLFACKCDMESQNSEMFASYDQSFQEILLEYGEDEEKLLTLKKLGLFLDSESKNFPLACSACKQEYQKLFENFLSRCKEGDDSAFSEFPKLSYLFPLSMEFERLSAKSLQKWSFSSLFSELPITDIIFSQCAVGESTAKIICSAPMLKKLHFYSCYFQHSFFEKIAFHGPSQLIIREIKIDYASISDCDLKTLLRIPLQTLELHNCSQITFSDFDFEDEQDDLKTDNESLFSEEENEEVKEEFSKALYDIRCITIQNLSILRCPSVHIGSVFAICNNFPNLDLSTLNIRDCQSISEQDFLILQEELQKKIGMQKSAFFEAIRI